MGTLTRALLRSVLSFSYRCSPNFPCRLAPTEDNVVVLIERSPVSHSGAPAPDSITQIPRLSHYLLLSGLFDNYPAPEEKRDSQDHRFAWDDTRHHHCRARRRQHHVPLPSRPATRRTSSTICSSLPPDPRAMHPRCYARQPRPRYAHSRGS